MSLESRIERNVLLSAYTTFKIGGPAKYFAEAKSIDEIQELCHWAKEKDISVFVLGGGSNVLISDKGFNGLVIRFLNSKFIIHDSKIIAEAGTSLARLVSETIKAELTGLEWAIGIPGTVGGAVCGNSRCFGGQISDVVESVKVLNVNNLTVEQFNNSNCDFGYHDSIFSARGGSAFGGKDSPALVILEVVFTLKKNTKDKIMQDIKDIVRKRLEAQPVGQKCAGSFFKNVEWKRKDINKNYLLKKFPELKQFSDWSAIPAGFLIDFMGLREKKIGEAMVDKKHVNFILNLSNATAEQILMLVSLIKDKIHSRYGFNLENEVQLIGF